MRRLVFGLWVTVGLWRSVFAPDARADDWPQWLGPQRDGVWRESGIPDKFPAEGPPVRWRQVIGDGYAGPSVAAGRVFVTDYLSEGDKTPTPDRRNRLEGSERVLCFSADDGQLLWKHEYPCSYHVSYPAGPRVTPTVDRDCVYTLGAMGNLDCLKTADGSVVWSRNLPKDFNTQTPHWGYAAHPLVDGDKLICVVGGEGSVAVAFDKRDGKELWRALSAPEPGYCPPTIIDAAGKRQLLIWHVEAVNSLNPETGELYWSVPLKPDYGMSIVAPRKWDDLLWVGGVEDKSMLLKLGQDKPSAELLWRGNVQKSIGPGSCTPILENGFLYGVDRHGQLRCVRLSDGERLWSTWDLTVGKRTSYGTAFLVKHEDRFFIVSETGELIIAQLSPEGHREISRCKVMEPTGQTFGRSVWWSHPAFANRCMYARNDKEVVCISLADR